MLQILDTLVIVLFILFLVYIFRGYHLSRLDRDQNKIDDDSDMKD